MDLVAEHPEHNLNDSSPRTALEWNNELQRRQDAGEIVYEVLYGGNPVGIVGVAQATPEVAAFHGIAFLSEMHGSGVPLEAVRRVIDRIFSYTSASKISATYHADNPRIRRFLQKLGAVDEGYLRQHIKRNGQMIDLFMIAIFKPQ